MIINFQGIKIQTSELVYTPREDTFFLEDKLMEYFTKPDNKNLILRIAEMGCGSGYLTICLMKLFSQSSFVVIDKNRHALDLTKTNIEINKLPASQVTFVESDLFTNVPTTCFDLLVFNPPYLPVENLNFSSLEEELIKDSWEGGTDLINNFLQTSKEYLASNGLIFLIVSNFQVIHNDVNGFIKSQHPDLEIVDYFKQKHGLETLFLLIIKKC